MKTSATKPVTVPHFDALPRDYASLCRLHLPRPIRDKHDHARALVVAEAFAGFEVEMTQDQTDYFDLLCSLIETWEAAHVKWNRLAPVKILQHLLDENHLSGADLSRILGVSRLLGPMILRGDREITAEHARTLGRHFGLSPGLFI